jgi:hypothetical protein
MSVNGKHGEEKTIPADRRLVLLKDGDASDVDRVLAEYRGAAAGSADLHAELQRFAAEYRGRCVAAEWESRLGWVRFVTCQASAC